ncbi:MAG: aldo/keto reductase [Spirochaetales bacterium]|jgi:aryl-alcohol dehydrogenase-like predicted oxidoreductase|nr:aldo/keto reductase [Spirochaetales bacterium]
MPANKMLGRHTIPNTDLSVSSICYGVMGCGTRIAGADMERVLDAFIEHGGNFFDTAHCYSFWLPGGSGASERSLGAYLSSREIRRKVVVATKGAHPPVEGYRDRLDWMTAGCIRDDLNDSLARLETDYVDLYWLHRDNPNVPVSEIIDILNAEVAAGRIRYFGGSNWRAERLRQANQWAKENGKMGFVASQPSWCLGWRPQFTNDQVAIDDSERSAYEEMDDIAVIPYNSTGNGYFATAGKKGASTYENTTSRERLGRCVQLANQIGATPNQVALAWLMHQRSLTIPIIGTCDYDHLIDALGAKAVQLSPAQVDRLSQGRA